MDNQKNSRPLRLIILADAAGINSKAPTKIDPIIFTDATVKEFSDLKLDTAISKSIFERTGKVDRIEVSVKK